MSIQNQEIKESTKHLLYSVGDNVALSDTASDDIGTSASSTDTTLQESGDAREIPPVNPPAKWDIETDVLIVGGGGSGLCAAAAALKNGAKVVVWEKQAQTGGHSQHAGLAASFNTAAAKRRRLYADRMKAFNHGYTIQSNSSIDPRLLATLIDRSHEVFDWSETQSWGKQWDAMTLGFIPDQGVARMIVKGTMRNGPFTSATELIGMMYPWLRWLAKHVTGKGGQILLNTKAVALVREGGRIVGAKGHAADGTTIFAKANKAVILAASGFSNNRAMLKKYCPAVYEKSVGSMLPPSDTGEAIRMALGAGADLAGKNSWMAFAGGIAFFDTKYTGKPKPGPWYQYLPQGWIKLARSGAWLEVNVAAAIWQTLPPPLIDDRPMTVEDPENPWFDSFRHLVPRNWLDSVKEAIELGGIKFSDTIEGLAEELGLDPLKLANAVNAWNRKAAAGKPDEFGRLPQNMKLVAKAPFYGIKTGALIAGTFCGPRVNYKCEVLDKNLDPIPNLYAAGLTAGGTNGEGVLNSTVLSTLGLAFTTGWIAGDNATGEASYVPTAMTLKSSIPIQRIINQLNKYFPRLAAFVMKAGYSRANHRRRSLK